MLRMLTNIYTERDVADVESYVRAAVMRGAPDIALEERERLVARGILVVRRIACALPPETSLDRVLRERDLFDVCRHQPHLGDVGLRRRLDVLATRDERQD